jgi:nucleotide-binding universal stress UspA family protein
MSTPHIEPFHDLVIAHATDLSGDDEAAFVHASALAAVSGARLVTVHAFTPEDAAARLPEAAVLAARWGRPIAHERRRYERSEEVADTVLVALRELRPGLVVLGTHGHHGLSALLRGSVAETIARNALVPALVVPNRTPGFVDAATGALELRRIVVPAGDATEGARGLAAARSLVALAGVIDARIELLHIGAEDPGLAGLGVGVLYEQGKLEDAIVDVARAHKISLVVMPTRGHDGIGDALLGSHTEHVIREVGCPVLTVPI